MTQQMCRNTQAAGLQFFVVVVSSFSKTDMGVPQVHVHFLILVHQTQDRLVWTNMTL